MNVQLILISALVATSLKSVWSYALSDATGAQFREPVLWGKVLRRITRPRYVTRRQKGTHVLYGWLVNYAIGIILVFAYALTWQMGWFSTSLLDCMLLGVASGLAAVAVWSLSFAMSRDMVVDNYLTYHVQLVLGHILFAITAGLVFDALT